MRGFIRDDGARYLEWEVPYLTSAGSDLPTDVQVLRGEGGMVGGSDEA